MKVAIVGLGLIGGSLAKAYKRREHVWVYGADKDKSVVNFASLAEAIDEKLEDEHIKDCDLILLATYPQGVIDWVTEKAALIGKNTMVIDCTGTKGRICEALFPVAKEHGFVFVGGHPMAGVHQAGFKHSREDMFDGQPMVIVPPSYEDIRLFERVQTLLEPLGFGRISVTTAEEHDSVIAFSSQMAHVVSNAFIKSPTAEKHKGYSAGSYQDMTRVAWLNPDMWSELFMENKEALLSELGHLLFSLGQYQKALEEENMPQLRELLAEGAKRKRQVDGP